MKRFIAILLSALVLVSLCGCDALGDFSLGNLFSGVNGSQWELNEMTDKGVVFDKDYLAQSGVTGSISFDKETFSMTLQGNTFEGTYVLSGTELTLTIGEETVSALCDDDVITMTIDGAILSFVKTE